MTTDQNNAAQPVLTEAALMDLEKQVQHDIPRFGPNVLIGVRAGLLRKMLSKLRAPVADERAALQRIVDTAKDGANSGDRHARCVEIARATLASAPVARPKRAPAGDWRVAAIGECLEAEWDEMTPDLAEANARIIVGYLIEYEKESALIEAKRANAPVAGNQPYPPMPKPDVTHPGEQEDSYSSAAVKAAMREAHDRGYSVGWDHGKEHASAPVAGEAVTLRAAREYLDQWGCLAEPNVRALLENAERAVPQASEAVRDADHPVFAFLLGEGPLRGVHFGERAPGAIGKWWWRQELRAALSAQPGAQRTGGSE